MARRDGLVGFGASYGWAPLLLLVATLVVMSRRRRREAAGDLKMT